MEGGQGVTGEPGPLGVDFKAVPIEVEIRQPTVTYTN